MTDKGKAPVQVENPTWIAPDSDVREIERVAPEVVLEPALLLMHHGPVQKEIIVRRKYELVVEQLGSDGLQRVVWA